MVESPLTKLNRIRAFSMYAALLEIALLLMNILFGIHTFEACVVMLYTWSTTYYCYFHLSALLRQENRVAS